MGIVTAVVVLFIVFSIVQFCNCADQAEIENYEKAVQQWRKEWKARKPFWKTYEMPLKDTDLPLKDMSYVPPEREIEWKL